MSAAILTIAHDPPNFATAVWLGGSGLSVCGLYIIQYFPIKAFTISDQEMGELVKEGNSYFDASLLAALVASPLIIALWAAILFLAGIIDYIIEMPLGGLRYKIFALIPIGLGVAVITMTMVTGGIIERRLAARVRYALLPTTYHSNSEYMPS